MINIRLSSPSYKIDFKKASDVVTLWFQGKLLEPLNISDIGTRNKVQVTITSEVRDTVDDAGLFSFSTLRDEPDEIQLWLYGSSINIENMYSKSLLGKYVYLSVWEKEFKIRERDWDVASANPLTISNYSFRVSAELCFGDLDS